MQYGHAFASVYDLFMQDVDYTSWAQFYIDCLSRAGVQGGRLVDAACGTGSLSLALARAGGFAITALDSAEAMLAVAQERIRRSGLDIALVMQDMRNMHMHRPVDAVVCGCDGVNYLASLTDMEAFFRSAFALLKPGGVLAFDISSAHKLQHILGDEFYGQQLENAAFLWQNHFDATQRLLEMDITFFIRKENGLYARVEELHLQRAHSQTEVEELLDKTGFICRGIWADQVFKPPEEKSERLFFMAQKS